MAVGVSHKSAPLQIREQIALTAKQAVHFAEELVARDGIEEAIVLSTCNRTELYAAVAGPPSERLAELTALLAGKAGLDDRQFSDISYALSGDQVERHLYGVTAGLDSMVLGESEIQGQVKRALEAGLQSGTTGPLASRLFSSALKAGKRVRSETSLGAARTSVASVAVDLAVKSVGSLQQRAITLIGTGETGELAAQALAARGAKPVLVAHLRIERAREIADRCGGEIADLSELPQRLAVSDIVVSATSSPHYLVEARELEKIVRRRTQPLVLIDLAVPRDIEPECRAIAGVEMYDIDDLQRVVDETMSLRSKERTAAQEIIEQEVKRFGQWLGSRQMPARTGDAIDLFADGSDQDDRESQPSTSA